MDDKSQISEGNFLFTSDNRWPTFFLLVSKAVVSVDISAPIFRLVCSSH